MAQQRVKCFSDSLISEEFTCKNDKAWLRKATKTALHEMNDIEEEANEYGNTYVCFCTTSLDLDCAAPWCHSLFKGKPAPNFVLNVHKFGQMNTFEIFKLSFVRDFYSWLYSEDGPWGVAMNDTVILEGDAGIPVGILWLDPKNTPVDAIVHSCITSRALTEHAEGLLEMVEIYEEFGDMGFAFAAANIRSPRDHSGYYPVKGKFPLPYITNKSSSANKLWKDTKGDLFINKYWREPSFGFAWDMPLNELFKKCQEEKEKNK